MTTLPPRQQLLNILIAHYDKGEAQAIARLYLERRFDLSHTDALLGKHFLRTPLHEQQWATDLEAFRRGVPVQYVLGSAEFDGHAFAVTPDVLIPRPETEGLVQWAAELASDQPAHLLDAGTGSGCIAVSLALRLPSATLTAWDISETALCVARCNAKALGADVAFLHRNIMTEAQCPTDAPASFHFSCCAQASSNRAAISSSINFFASSRSKFAVLMLTIAAMRCGETDITRCSGAFAAMFRTSILKSPSLS